MHVGRLHVGCLVFGIHRSLFVVPRLALVDAVAVTVSV